MAFDSEEWQRRRELRKQQKALRAEKKKKTVRLVAIITAGILCLALALVLILSGNSRSSGNTPSEDTQAAQNQTVIHLVAGGDLNVNDRTATQDMDYTAAFLDVAHLLSEGSVSMLNFEGSLLGAPYGSATASAPQAMMQALSSAGVDFIQLANSYSIFHGMKGLVSTINGVKETGMTPLGVYATSEEFREQKGFTLIDVQGVTIALVAFTKGMDGLALPAGNENCVNVLYKDYQSTYQTVDTEGITAVLENVSRAKPDITVALLHWGSEFNDTVSTSQKRIVTLMQENGVDAIIGTHPHYVQEISYDGETGAFLAYSLGDFFGDAQRAGSEYSILLDLEITKDLRSGDAKISGYTYTPIFTVAEEDQPPRVVRIHEAIAAYEAGHIDRVSQGTYEDMKYALTRIEARIAGD